MNDKPGKSSREDSKKADKAVESDHPADEKANRKPLRHAGEGSDNLRQRAEWFRQREGGDK